MNADEDKPGRSRRSGVPPVLADGSPAPDYSDGRLEIRPGDRVVLTDGRQLQLAPAQLGILVELLRNAGRTVSRERLLAAVWGPEADAGARAVDVAVARLRAQLRRRIPGVVYVHTDVGRGYRFDRMPA